MKRTWLLLISLFNLCILVAQPTYHIKHYSVNDGMSQGIVQTIIQDKKGFLWFGTWNGLNKFDGYTFKNYKTSYKDGYILNTNRISQIAETKYGESGAKPTTDGCICSTIRQRSLSMYWDR